MNAPLALFVYKRLWHAQKTVESLQKNVLARHSDLYIFSDGPRHGDQEAVGAVRAWIRQIVGFNKVHIIERPQNLGLADSIIEGVTQLVSQFGKVIVIEDDLVVSPFFLNYMNDGLEMYQQAENVASIHGYMFPISGVPEIFFLRGADCWGWATWERAWGKFESDGKKLLAALQQQKLIKAFNYNNTQANVQMLKNQIIGKNNSWAIRWHASAFLHNMITLYPGKSLVCNIGLDNSGEHCGESKALEVSLHFEPMTLKPIPAVHNEAVFAQLEKYFKSVQEPLHRRALRKLKSMVCG